MSQINTGDSFTDLTVIRKDAGRRTRDGTGAYYRCVCVCGKFVSVRDKHLVEKTQISCKLSGLPCKKEVVPRITFNSVHHGWIVKMNEDPSKSPWSLKDKYWVECIECGDQVKKRGDTIVNGKAGKCHCQSTENQNKSS